MSEFALIQHAVGVILPVKAQPGARRSAVTGIHNGMLKVAVTQAPERGKANRAIIAVLSDALAVRKSQLELIAGETTSSKQFLVRGVTITELTERIEQVVK